MMCFGISIFLDRYAFFVFMHKNIDQEEKMKQQNKRIITVFLCLGLWLSCWSMAAAANNQQVEEAITDTAAYLQRTVSNPVVSSIGGEWSVLGLARSGQTVPQSYYDTYYNNLVNTLKENDGVLHDKKYTEYSRVILALTAIGKDSSNVGGYNLLEKLGDYDKVVWQGINGPIFALLALDSHNYSIPTCEEAKTQATRELYIKAILDQQLADGGFALSGNQADPDITGMALQALAKYQNREDVKTATEKALTCLSNLQDETGGYTSWGDANLESAVQVLVALCELDIDVDDSRFVKNGKTLVDNVLSYYQKGNGFVHTASGEGSSGMSTEQGFYALVALQRVTAGKTSLYDMTDVALSVGTTDENNANGLTGKHDDVKEMPIVAAGKTFTDIQNHPNQTAIEALAARNIINGMTETTFLPEQTMTRAEFAAIITRGLGLSEKATNTFADIQANTWYAGYIGTANTYGIVKGVSANQFAPNATITKEEAATMIARAANLCGMDMTMTAAETRDMLAQFEDYTTVSDWAQDALAFCYQNNILSQTDLTIAPKTAIKRCEIAEMLYRMLDQAQLLS